MARKSYPIIDTDVHHTGPAIDVLAEYMPGVNVDSYYSAQNGLLLCQTGIRSGIPNNRGTFRADTAPPNGGVPGTDPKFVAEDLLDRHGIDYAVLNSGTVNSLGGHYDPDTAAAVARATNDWTINEWLAADDRYLGSIHIAPQDPEQAADEIRRHASNPRMVQALLNTSPYWLGHRFMHPIWEACNESGIPLSMHIGGADGGISRGGWTLNPPTNYVWYHLAYTVPAINHVTSMITEGVFVKYPNTRFLANEFGCVWLPYVMWRLDWEYRAGMDDVPWLTKMPSEYMKEFLRFTTQPLEEPERPKDLVTLLSLIDGQDMLVFSSDYPHWDADNPDWVLRAFPDDWKQKIFYDNANEFFRLEERLGVKKTAVAGVA